MRARGEIVGRSKVRRGRDNIHTVVLQERALCENSLNICT